MASLGGGTSADDASRFSRFSSDGSMFLPSKKRSRRIIRWMHSDSLGLDGSGDGSGGMPGELRHSSMRTLKKLLAENCHLTSSSRFLDIGSGLGTVVVYMAAIPGVEMSKGIEMIPQVADRSIQTIQKLKEKFCPSIIDPDRVCIVKGDATREKTFDPYTHLFCASSGIEPKTLKQFMLILKASTTPQYFQCNHAMKSLAKLCLPVKVCEILEPIPFQQVANGKANNKTKQNKEQLQFDSNLRGTNATRAVYFYRVLAPFKRANRPMEKVLHSIVDAYKNKATKMNPSSCNSKQQPSYEKGGKHFLSFVVEESTKRRKGKKTILSPPKLSLQPPSKKTKKAKLKRNDAEQTSRARSLMFWTPPPSSASSSSPIAQQKGPNRATKRMSKIMETRALNVQHDLELEERSEAAAVEWGDSIDLAATKANDLALGGRKNLGVTHFGPNMSSSTSVKKKERRTTKRRRRKRVSSGWIR